jgi:hypothetical protein
MEVNMSFIERVTDIVEKTMRGAESVGSKTSLPVTNDRDLNEPTPDTDAQSTTSRQ